MSERAGSESDVTERTVGGHVVRGVAVGPETRCAHWTSDRDVVAIRAPCCGGYYPCHACHDALADHAFEPIPASAFDDPGVLCGVCGTALAVGEYLECGHACPACGAAFNPGCAAHHDRYFEGCRVDAAGAANESRDV
jgi:uncharacterized CHY-type Zn-finger protein